MRGRKPEADHRFTFHGSWERAENDADGRGSFATVERSMSTGSQVRLFHPDSTGAGGSWPSSHRGETNAIGGTGYIPADSWSHHVSGTAEWPPTHIYNTSILILAPWPHLLVAVEMFRCFNKQKFSQLVRRLNRSSHFCFPLTNYYTLYPSAPLPPQVLLFEWSYPSLSRYQGSDCLGLQLLHIHGRPQHTP